MSYRVSEWSADGPDFKRYVDLYDFIKAYLQYEECRREHEERGAWDARMVAYHEAQVEAYVKVFGIDPRGYGKSGSGPGDPQEFFWQGAVKTYVNLTSPFGVYLEGGPGVEEQQFMLRNPVSELLRLTKAAFVNMMVDGIKQAHPEADKLVEADEVKPEWTGPVPDAMDYW